MSQAHASLQLDAEQLYAVLLKGVQKIATPDMALVGVWSGGAWLAERLSRDLGRTEPHGCISSALHRDDFSRRGMAVSRDATQLPFEIEGRHILLIDDVLYTGRTTRAVINELFDYGRPASVTLVVLVDRGGRELPIEPVFSAARIILPADQRVALGRDEQGQLTFHFERV
ncbi:MAG TPA: bifunctional pyr operon transcriptional regulator/uracil phosphoribosyltransferase PyrR [Aquabacterium sp.]|uniref:bifunctional pyr operon transcriptional regulator/uracil phosphoribosyltransferase PyrR n=1 Tax=Aquabacterium sp. TaxID=1872578 RepID=UPI002DAB7029|nr:bifunctional pyr operon transcriptional regulator/uracil phosphoribosyltransferase PyrR [Aquabacterium sp.]HET6789530.1 bifunctional pyr operon transcriptional regulator/uracil phosphoribosyltransferase PyrR [Aquabacterium sp.]HEX5374426.1 bifunctional pyr operon transcriptional regulator/uracil phosphoribosyltransferase PyrR [Aquabacterium sp.]